MIKHAIECIVLNWQDYTIPIPEAFHHRRIEVLLIAEEETSSLHGLKSLLADMPDVGDDN